jgi:hypothetical protein
MKKIIFAAVLFFAFITFIASVKNSFADMAPNYFEDHERGLTSKAPQSLISALLQPEYIIIGSIVFIIIVAAIIVLFKIRKK